MCDIHPSAVTARHVVARLPHQCDSCFQWIVIGEVYHYTSGIWDGSPERFRRHLLCSLLESQLKDDEGCWLYGSLAEARDFNDRSPTFRRAWETVFQRPWGEPEDEDDKD